MPQSGSSKGCENNNFLGLTVKFAGMRGLEVCRKVRNEISGCRAWQCRFEADSEDNRVSAIRRARSHGAAQTRRGEDQL
eukprot:2625397-Alexandrium_andersonii.AAC.1